MANKKRKKERTKVDTEDKLSLGDRIRMTLRSELPAPLEAKCQPLMFIGIAFLVAAIVFLIISSLRSMAPFALFVSILIFIFAYMRRAEMVFTGYDEYYFKTLDYTYLMKRQKSPSGIVLLGVEGPEGTHVENEIYHVAAEGANSLPELGCLLKVYVPKDAVVSSYANRKYFSKVFAYDVEAYDI